MLTIKRLGVVLLLVVVAAVVAAQERQATVFPPSAEQKTQIHAKLAELSARLAGLGGKKTDPQLLADVQIYKKAVDYILRFPEEFFGPNYAAETIQALDTGIGRAIELEEGTASWTKKTGNVVRAFVSRIDGSVQPYGLTIPSSYDGSKPMRLDVWLHGTSIPTNEVRFLAKQATDHADANAPTPTDYIQLEPFGRMNHSYRYWGETDVFEAIASVQQRYNVDPERILIRGHSMGGQGAWHLGLQHPGKFAGIESSAGYADTYTQAGDRMKPLLPLPPHQVAALHYYDAVDYALNAFNTPVVGYVGETDANAGARLMRQALEKEGFRFTQQTPYRWTTNDLRALFLVGPKTGHVWHAESKAESEAFLRKALDETAGKSPHHVRFVTYTARWNNAHWLNVNALEETYKRAEVDAKRTDDLKQYTVTTKNVMQLQFDVPAASFTIDGQTIKAGANPAFEKAGGKWALATGRSTGLRKIHGLQGPIEDAFRDDFLAVRGTGQPWHADVHGYTSQRFDVFRTEFAKWMRGDIRVKDDHSVSASDIANYNLVLFGDPGSNSVMAKLVGGLPIEWTRTGIAIGPQRFPAAGHALVLIYPNPLNRSRYVVLNTGHTFSANRVLSGTESVFFPRLGDYAVLTSGGEVKVAGFFDESWRLKP